MEIRLISGYKDSVLFKLLAPKLPKNVTITEINSNDRVSASAEFEFKVWPVLYENGTPFLYGTRAILTYLFTGSELLQQASLTQNDTLFYLGDDLYTAFCPIFTRTQSILVNDKIIAHSQKAFDEVIAQIPTHKTKEESIGNYYIDSILAIVKALGFKLDLEVPQVTLQADAIAEEALRFCFQVLNIPERYALSPAPEKPMCLTTPIYYVNGVPHIGHVFTTTLVETISNWYKLRGIDCIYSTGTDEHGLKVQTTAASKGFSPKEWCDKTSKTFFDAFEQFDLHPDVFIRTTDENHIKVATKLWTILHEKGYIYEGKYEGWYSKREECFVPENQIKVVVENGVEKHINSEDGAELEWSSETNWMFKLSAMQQQLLDWYDANPTCITPRPYYNLIKLMVSRGLNDLSVSRQNVTWGIPVPNDPKQTMYVWIDALANYLTVAGWDGEGNFGRWPCDIHTVGKDIVKFHAIYWPAFLIAAGIPCYKRLLVHGWWTKNEEKMSKSLGNTLDPIVLMKFWGLEAVKYYLLRECTLVSDSDYSDKAMLNRYNNDLADVLWNLVIRIISKKLCPDMVVPTPGEYQEVDKDLIESIVTIPGTVDHFMAFGETRHALDSIFASIHDLNKYLTDMQPWKLVKETDLSRYNTVFYTLLECLRILATSLYCFMPQTATTILNGLGVGKNFPPEEIFKYGFLKPGTKLMEGMPILFPKKTLPDV